LVSGFPQIAHYSTVFYETLYQDFIHPIGNGNGDGNGNDLLKLKVTSGGQAPDPFHYLSLSRPRSRPRPRSRVALFLHPHPLLPPLSSFIPFEDEDRTRTRTRTRTSGGAPCQFYDSPSPGRLTDPTSPLSLFLLPDRKPHHSLGRSQGIPGLLPVACPGLGRQGSGLRLSGTKV